MTLVSSDYDLLETFRDCLGLEASITPHMGGFGSSSNRIQWGDRNFYDWLLIIGLMPAKSLRLGPLAIPDEYFADFMRGCIDGDGSIVTYIDRYNTFKSPKYVYTRLFVSIVSASYAFLEWLQGGVARLIDVNGALFLDKESAPGRARIWELKYAKHESIRLLRWMYYAPNIPCLERKHEKAQPFLIDSE